MFRWLRDHGVIERNVVLMGVLTLLTVSIGGLVQIVPLFTVETTIERVQGVRPYTPLEQMGRNIYVREGCYVCHSQMIRPFRDELERYGHFSLRIWRVLVGVIQMIGMRRICALHVPWCRLPSCRPIPSSIAPWIMNVSRTISAPCVRWVCLTATR